MDAGGKDGTVKILGCGLHPGKECIRLRVGFLTFCSIARKAGCHVISFKEPTAEELAHDFLWRCEKETPRKGQVTIFNRSHYEDVLVVRVHNVRRDGCCILIRVTLALCAVGARRCLERAI
jgi:polyphosphate kinase 2 (PPK2 family)